MTHAELQPPVGLAESGRLLGFFATLAWILLVAAASVGYRLYKGRYILRPRFPNALFCEKWRSGRSHRNLITRLGGASGCLWVAVTADELLVGPHFPFNLLFLPEMYGLEYRASGADIEMVALRRTLFGGQRAVVELRTGQGVRETFELALRDPDKFISVVEGLRKSAATSAPRILGR